MRTAAAILAVLCVVQAQQAPGVEPVNLLPPADAAFDPKGYYLVRRDRRKCAAPQCGGYWIRSVNKRKLRCANGKRRRRCYVSDIIAPAGAPRFTPSTMQSILVKGMPSQHPSHPGLGVLNLEVSHTQASGATARGRGFFVGIKDAGLRCFTAPCASLTEYRLNARWSRALAGIEFDKRLDAKAVDWARGQIAGGNVVVVTGRHTRVTGPAGTAVGFKANQIYMPDEVALECPEGYTLHKDACRTPYGCAYPEIELTGTGGARPRIDDLTGRPISNIHKSCTSSCAPPAFLESPGQCAIYYP